MYQLCHVFFPLSCWLCPPRLSCALVHSIHVRVSLPSTPLPSPSHATCSFHSSCWLCPPGLSCVLVHSSLVKCRVSLLTPVYTFAMSQSYHVFFPLQLLALFSQTVLCSNSSRPADGICAPPCRLCLVPLFSRRDDSGPSPVGRVMERECQTMGTRDEQLACY